MRFADTSFWVALFLDRDDRHEQARTLRGQRPGALLCTNHVLGETWTFVRRRQGHAQAVQELDALNGSRRCLTVLRVPQNVEQEAWDCGRECFVHSTSAHQRTAGGVDEGVLAFTTPPQPSSSRHGRYPGGTRAESPRFPAASL